MLLAGRLWLLINNNRQSSPRMFAENRPDAIRGIVFDAVGTLIDPIPPVAEVYAQAALRQGVELDPGTVRERFRRAFGTDEIDEQGGPLATSEAIEHRRWQRIVAACLPEVPHPHRAFEELWDHFGRPESWQAAPDAGPTLRALDRRGLALRIASNFDARLRGVLRGLEALAPWGESALISSEVGRRKPHPDFYRAVCESLGLPPEVVLCVGDDIENDWQGPRRAGLQAVLLDRDGRAPADVPTIRGLDALLGGFSIGA